MPYRNLAAIARSEQALAARAWPALTVTDWRRRARAISVTGALSAALAFGGWAASMHGVAIVGLFLLTLLETARRVIAVRVRNRWREVAARTAVLMRDERFAELGLALDRAAPLARWSPAILHSTAGTRRRTRTGPAHGHRLDRSGARAAVGAGGAAADDLRDAGLRCAARRRAARHGRGAIARRRVRGDGIRRVAGRRVAPVMADEQPESSSMPAQPPRRTEVRIDMADTASTQRLVPHRTVTPRA